MSSDVWLPIVTLVLGYMFSLITEAVRDRRQSDREKQARADEREAVTEAQNEEAERRRRDFQRDTLLELQEVLHDLARAQGVTFIDGQWKEGGSWSPPAAIGGETNDAGRVAAARSTILLARVDDEELRSLVHEMKDAGSAMWRSRTLEKAVECWDRIMDAFEKANGRIGVLLRKVY